MNDQQRDEVLLGISTSVGELSGFVTRLQAHVEGLQGRVMDVKELLASAMTRIGEHTDRITMIERELASHLKWRAKLGGVWVAMSIGAAVIATITGLAVALIK